MTNLLHQLPKTTSFPSTSSLRHKIGCMHERSIIFSLHFPRAEAVQRSTRANSIRKTCMCAPPQSSLTSHTTAPPACLKKQVTEKPKCAKPQWRRHEPKKNALLFSLLPSLKIVRLQQEKAIADLLLSAPHCGMPIIQPYPQNPDFCPQNEQKNEAGELWLLLL